VALQYGVPLKDLVNKFSHIRFEPAGFTGNPEIPMAKSLVDYVFRYLGSKFLSSDEKDAIGIISQMSLTDVKASGGAATGTTASLGSAAPPHAASPLVDSGPERSAEGTEADPAQPEAVAPEAQGTEETAAKGILDGLKVVAKNGEAKDRAERLAVGQAPVVFDTADSPACTDCGSIMVRYGSCYKCINCGATSGCS
jgi:ribonucleoside-diphosphate reductase alpha chain